MKMNRTVRRTVSALFVLGGFFLLGAAPLAAQVESARVAISGMT